LRKLGNEVVRRICSSKMEEVYGWGKSYNKENGANGGVWRTENKCRKP
jgi:hypothetical protein